MFSCTDVVSREINKDIFDKIDTCLNYINSVDEIGFLDILESESLINGEIEFVNNRIDELLLSDLSDDVLQELKNLTCYMTKLQLGMERLEVLDNIRASTGKRRLLQ